MLDMTSILTWLITKKTSLWFLCVYIRLVQLSDFLYWIKKCFERNTNIDFLVSTSRIFLTPAFALHITQSTGLVMVGSTTSNQLVNKMCLSPSFCIFLISVHSTGLPTISSSWCEECKLTSSTNICTSTSVTGATLLQCNVILPHS